MNSLQITQEPADLHDLLACIKARRSIVPNPRWSIPMANLHHMACTWSMLITPKDAGNLLLFAASIRINTTLSIEKVYYIGKHSYTCVEEWLLLIRLTNMLVHVRSSVRCDQRVGELVDLSCKRDNCERDAFVSLRVVLLEPNDVR